MGEVHASRSAEPDFSFELNGSRYEAYAPAGASSEKRAALRAMLTEVIPPIALANERHRATEAAGDFYDI